MASFVEFPQSNKLLKAREGTRHEVGDLPMYQQAPLNVQEKYNKERVAEGHPELQINYPDGPPLCISGWKLTPEELAEINRTGVVWVHCSGYTHGPISIQGRNPWGLDWKPDEQSEDANHLLDETH